MKNTTISILTSLYNCEEYLHRYFEHVLKIENLYEIEFIFIHNAATKNEKEIVFSYLNRHSHINYQYIEVAREKIYASWNRGIKAATGQFIAIWNVDDIRMPYSLKQQAEKLLSNPDFDMVYGNIQTIFHLNDNAPLTLITKDITNKRHFHYFQEGAFLMWRKAVHDVVGYFDEQFMIRGDADFWLRLAEKSKIIKTENVLGIYLKEAGKGISKSSKTADYEDFIVGLRYGFYPRLVFNPFAIGKALKKINPKQIHCFGLIYKRAVLKYKSPLVYFMSFFSLVFLLIPLFVLSRMINLNKYNYHFFKKIIYKQKN